MAKILICDDSDFMRDVIKTMLEDSGHDVVGTAASGKEGVEKYKKLKPDIVTMDMLMEDSGSDAISGIIKLDPKARIIIISVLSEQEESVVEGIRQGALGIVTKPIKKELLLAEVDRVLKI